MLLLSAESAAAVATQSSQLAPRPPMLPIDGIVAPSGAASGGPEFVSPAASHASMPYSQGPWTQWGTAWDHSINSITHANAITRDVNPNTAAALESIATAHSSRDTSNNNRDRRESDVDVRVVGGDHAAVTSNTKTEGITHSDIEGNGPGHSNLKDGKSVVALAPLRVWPTSDAHGHSLTHGHGHGQSHLPPLSPSMRQRQHDVEVLRQKQQQLLSQQEQHQQAQQNHLWEQEQKQHLQQQQRKPAITAANPVAHAAPTTPAQAAPVPTHSTVNTDSARNRGNLHETRISQPHPALVIHAQAQQVSKQSNLTNLKKQIQKFQCSC